MGFHKVFSGTLFLLWSFYGAGQQLSARDYYQLGLRLYGDARYDSAARVFDQAALAFRTAGDTSAWIRSSFEKGESLANLGRCEEAASIITAALDLHRGLAGEADTLMARGYYYLSRAAGGCGRDFGRAIALVKRSAGIRLAALGPSHPVLGFDYTMLGYYYNATGKHDSAIYYLNKALELRTGQAEVDSLQLSHTLFYLAKSYDGLGDVFKALELGERSLLIRQKQLYPGHPTISNSLSDIGTIYRTVGNYDRALPYMRQALEMRKKTLGEDHVNVGASYYAIGVLYGSMFNYQRAIDFIQQGNLIIEEALGEDTPVLHTYFAYLGAMYGHVGRHEEAIKYLMKARTLAEKYLEPDHLYQGIIYAFIGNYYSETAAVEDQITYLEKASTIFQKALGPGSIREADVITELGEGYLQKGDWAMAECHLDRALAMIRKLMGEKNPKTATIHQHLGDLYAATGEREKARSAYLKSLNALSPDSIQDDLELEIGSLTHQQLALMGLQKMALLDQAIGDEDHLRSAHARYLLAISLIDAISQSYDLEVSRAQLGEDTRQVFEGAVKVAGMLYQRTGEERYKRDAFMIVEKSKSPILLSKIKDLAIKRSLGVPDHLLAAERDLNVELSYYKRKLREATEANDDSLSDRYQHRIFTIRSRSDSLRDQLESDYPQYFEFKYQEAISDIEVIRSHLGEETLVLEYFLTDTAGYVFDLSNDHFEMRQFRVQADLADMVGNYTESLTDPDLILGDSRKADSLFTHAAFHLYGELMDAALAANAAKRRLIIVPDGFLSQINFNVLIRSMPEVVNYAKLDYLIKYFDISYAWSATLNSRAIQHSGDLSFAGFAPSYKAEAYSGMDSTKHPMTYELVREGKLPLPGAIAEVEAIGKMMDGETWLKAEASETNFKTRSGDYGILHLAMHSLLNVTDPQYSELLFSDENDSVNDGFLAIDEIYNLNLSAAMVVLSACSSGRGALQVGEGPISFGRAFSYAGCPGVIMSLWKVPDEATSEIMIGFYENIESGATRDGALRQAQLHYLQNEQDPLKQHPFYWAGFVAMGDTQPVGRKNGAWVFWFLAGAIGLIGAAVAFWRRIYARHS